MNYSTEILLKVISRIGSHWSQTFFSQLFRMSNSEFKSEMQSYSCRQKLISVFLSLFVTVSTSNELESMIISSHRKDKVSSTNLWNSENSAIQKVDEKIYQQLIVMHWSESSAVVRTVNPPKRIWIGFRHAATKKKSQHRINRTLSWDRLNDKASHSQKPTNRQHDTLSGGTMDATPAKPWPI
jgi:hypothetical protein